MDIPAPPHKEARGEWEGIENGDTEGRVRNREWIYLLLLRRRQESQGRGRGDVADWLQGRHVHWKLCTVHKQL